MARASVTGSDLEAARCWGHGVGLVCNFNLTKLSPKDIPFRDKRHKGYPELHAAFLNGFHTAVKGN